MSEVCPTCGSAKKREFIWTYSTVNSGCTPKAHDSWHDEKVDSLPVEAQLDKLVADLRDHYNTDWDTTVPGGEFNAEIRRIVLKYLSAAGAEAKPATKEEEDGTDCTATDQSPASDSDISGGENSVGTSQKTVTRFTIEVLQEKDGRWLADIPSVPGAMAYGEDETEATEDALFLRGQILKAESRAEKL